MTIDRGDYNTFLGWLDRFYQASEGLQRPNGLSIGGRPDFEGVAAWTEVYMNARLRGEGLQDAVNLVAANIRASEEWQQKHQGPTPPPVPPGPLPAKPSRDLLLRGQTTQQGLIIHTDEFGDMPWWGACWPWLSPASRAQAAQQLLAKGERICIMQKPDGAPLYDEGGQFYGPDRFGPLRWTEQQLADLVKETLGYGFAGCWVFWGGDDGNRGGYFQSVDEAVSHSRVFASQGADLNDYVVQLPAWDGGWHKPDALGVGYTPQQIRQFSIEARAAGAKHLGFEHGTGYILAGEGGADYLPGGVMSGYDLILGEFFDEQFETGDVWQLLDRYLGPEYVMPADQKAIIAAGPSHPKYPEANDPNPIYVLKPGSARGPYVYRVFEYFMYGFVRGASPARVAASRAKFQAMGAKDVC